MQAIVYTTYGSSDVLNLEEVATPTPNDNEVLIKVHAASLNAYDWHLMRADPFLVRIGGRGFFKPKNTIPGADVAGVVAAVGKHVTQFRPGDAVFGDLSSSGDGALAEYAIARENALVLKPDNLTFPEAAAVPMAAITALQGLRDSGQIQPGKKVLINGASGGVGTFAVQLAKVFQAEVTAVCSTGKMELVRTLGADHVIDYTKENFTRGDARYDLILGVNGYHPLADYKRVLAPKGIYVMAGGTNAQIFDAMLRGSLMSLRGDKKMTNVTAKIVQSDLEFLRGLLESGQVVAIIDRCYPLAAARDAMRYLEEGHARGKIINTIIE